MEWRCMKKKEFYGNREARGTRERKRWRYRPSKIHVLLHVDIRFIAYDRPNRTLRALEIVRSLASP